MAPRDALTNHTWDQIDLVSFRVILLAYFFVPVQEKPAALPGEAASSMRPTRFFSEHALDAPQPVQDLVLSIYFSAVSFLENAGRFD